MQLLAKLKRRVRDLETECIALCHAARQPQTPWHAKLVVAAVVAYALSPIDLIPDFVPVVGLMDDLVVVPLGIALAVKLVPPAVMAECRARARGEAKPRVRAANVAAAIVVAVWIGLSLWGALWIYRVFFQA
jgi:uncharacterized membrane protein YkvA (DUF1232 family)